MKLAEADLSAALATADAQPTNPTNPDNPDNPDRRDLPKPVYAFDLEAVTYEHRHATITGAEVMAAANIPVTEGIIRILPDCSREAIGRDTLVELATGAQFRRRPRFKRG